MSEYWILNTTLEALKEVDGRTKMQNDIRQYSAV